MKIIVDSLDLEDFKEMGIESWPVRVHNEEKFEWFYDKTEYCYIAAGEATIVSEFETLTVKPGDFITFPAGLEVIWDIDTAVKTQYMLE